MKARVGELFEEFQRIEQRLEAILASANEPPEDLLRGLDRQLADAFDQILTIELSERNELESRIVFLTEQVCKLVFDNNLAIDMLNQINRDATKLNATIPPPYLNIVSNNGEEIDEDNVLIELCYTSVATSAMNPEDLAHLRDQAIASNKRNDITGLLTFDDKNRQFMQLLEGPRTKVGALIERIIKDTRHQEVVIRFQSPIEQRLYHRWAMATITTSQVEDDIAPNQSIKTWIEEFLDLGANEPNTRGHRWMVDTISSRIS